MAGKGFYQIKKGRETAERIASKHPNSLVGKSYKQYNSGKFKKPKKRNTGAGSNVPASSQVPIQSRKGKITTVIPEVTIDRNTGTGRYVFSVKTPTAKAPYSYLFDRRNGYEGKDNRVRTRGSQYIKNAESTIDFFNNLPDKHKPMPIERKDRVTLEDKFNQLARYTFYDSKGRPVGHIPRATLERIKFVYKQAASDLDKIIAAKTNRTSYDELPMTDSEKRFQDTEGKALSYFALIQTVTKLDYNDDDELENLIKFWELNPGFDEAYRDWCTKNTSSAYRYNETGRKSLATVFNYDATPPPEITNIDGSKISFTPEEWEWAMAYDHVSHMDLENQHIDAKYEKEQEKKEIKFKKARSQALPWDLEIKQHGENPKEADSLIMDNIIRKTFAGKSSKESKAFSYQHYFYDPDDIAANNIMKLTPFKMFTDIADYFSSYVINPILKGEWYTAGSNILGGLSEDLDILAGIPRVAIASYNYKVGGTRNALHKLGIVDSDDTLVEGEDIWWYSGGKELQQILLDLGANDYKVSKSDLYAKLREYSPRYGVNLVNEYEKFRKEYDEFALNRLSHNKFAENLKKFYTEYDANFDYNTDSFLAGLVLYTITDPTLVIGGGAKVGVKVMSKSAVKSSVKGAFKDTVKGAFKDVMSEFKNADVFEAMFSKTHKKSKFVDPDLKSAVDEMEFFKPFKDASGMSKSDINQAYKRFKGDIKDKDLFFNNSDLLHDRCVSFAKELEPLLGEERSVAFSTALMRYLNQAKDNRAIRILRSVDQLADAIDRTMLKIDFAIPYVTFKAGKKIASIISDTKMRLRNVKDEDLVKDFIKSRVTDNQEVNPLDPDKVILRSIHEYSQTKDHHLNNLLFDAEKKSDRLGEFINDCYASKLPSNEVKVRLNGILKKEYNCDSIEMFERKVDEAYMRYMDSPSYELKNTFRILDREVKDIKALLKRKFEDQFLDLAESLNEVQTIGELERFSKRYRYYTDKELSPDIVNMIVDKAKLLDGSIAKEDIDVLISNFETSNSIPFKRSDVISSINDEWLDGIDKAFNTELSAPSKTVLENIFSYFDESPELVKRASSFDGTSSFTITPNNWCYELARYYSTHGVVDNVVPVELYEVLEHTLYNWTVMTEGTITPAMRELHSSVESLWKQMTDGVSATLDPDLILQQMLLDKSSVLYGFIEDPDFIRVYKYFTNTKQPIGKFLNDIRIKNYTIEDLKHLDEYTTDFLGTLNSIKTLDELERFSEFCPNYSGKDLPPEIVVAITNKASDLDRTVTKEHLAQIVDNFKSVAKSDNTALINSLARFKKEQEDIFSKITFPNVKDINEYTKSFSNTYTSANTEKLWNIRYNLVDALERDRAIKGKYEIDTLKDKVGIKRRPSDKRLLSYSNVPLTKSVYKKAKLLPQEMFSNVPPEVYIKTGEKPLYLNKREKKFLLNQQRRTADRLLEEAYKLDSISMVVSNYIKRYYNYDLLIDALRKNQTTGKPLDKKLVSRLLEGYPEKEGMPSKELLERVLLHPERTLEKESSVFLRSLYDINRFLDNYKALRKLHTTLKYGSAKLTDIEMGAYMSSLTGSIDKGLDRFPGRGLSAAEEVADKTSRMLNNLYGSKVSLSTFVTRLKSRDPELFEKFGKYTKETSDKLDDIIARSDSSPSARAQLEMLQVIMRDPATVRACNLKAQSKSQIFINAKAEGRNSKIHKLLEYGWVKWVEIPEESLDNLDEIIRLLTDEKNYVSGEKIVVDSEDPFKAVHEEDVLNEFCESLQEGLDPLTKDFPVVYTHASKTMSKDILGLDFLIDRAVMKSDTGLYLPKPAGEFRRDLTKAGQYESVFQRIKHVTGSVDIDDIQRTALVRATRDYLDSISADTPMFKHFDIGNFIDSLENLIKYGYSSNFKTKLTGLLYNKEYRDLLERLKISYNKNVKLANSYKKNIVNEVNQYKFVSREYYEALKKVPPEEHYNLQKRAFDAQNAGLYPALASREIINLGEAEKYFHIEGSETVTRLGKMEDLTTQINNDINFKLKADPSVELTKISDEQLDTAIVLYHAIGRGLTDVHPDKFIMRLRVPETRLEKMLMLRHLSDFVTSSTRDAVYAKLGLNHVDTHSSHLEDIGKVEFKEFIDGYYDSNFFKGSAGAYANKYESLAEKRAESTRKVILDLKEGNKSFKLAHSELAAFGDVDSPKSLMLNAVNQKLVNVYEFVNKLENPEAFKEYMSVLGGIREDQFMLQAVARLFKEEPGHPFYGVESELLFSKGNVITVAKESTRSKLYEDAVGALRNKLKQSNSKFWSWSEDSKQIYIAINRKYAPMYKTDGDGLVKKFAGDNYEYRQLPRKAIDFPKSDEIVKRLPSFSGRLDEIVSDYQNTLRTFDEYSKKESAEVKSEALAKYEKALSDYSDELNKFIQESEIAYPIIRDIYNGIDYLTDGASIGSLCELFTLDHYENFLKTVDRNISEKCLGLDVVQDRANWDRTSFNFNIIGDKDHRLKIGLASEFEDYDILYNGYKTFSEVSNRATFKSTLPTLWGDKSPYLFRDIFADVSDADVKEIFKNNNDFAVAILTKDEEQPVNGDILFKVKELNMQLGHTPELARESNAIIIPYDLMYRAQDIFNNREFTNVFAKMFMKYLVYGKLFQLINKGTILRNILDATFKNAIEMESVPDAIAYEVLALRRIHAYRKMAKKFKKTGRDTLTRYEYDNLLTESEKLGMSYRDMLKLHNYLTNNSLSGGRTATATNISNRYKNAFKRGEVRTNDDFKSYGSETRRFEDLTEAEQTELASRVSKKFYREHGYSDKEDFMNAVKTGQINTYNPKQQYAYAQVVREAARKSNRTFKYLYKNKVAITDDLISFFFTPMSRSEEIVRYAEFMAMEDRGLTASGVEKAITKTHFNYSLKSKPFKVLEAFAPYSLFQIENFLYWCRVVETNPRALRFVQREQDTLSYDAVNEYYEDEGGVSENEYLQKLVLQRGPVFSNLGQVYFKLNPSYLDAYNWFFSAPEDWISNLITPFDGLIKAFVQDDYTLYDALFDENRELALKTFYASNINNRISWLDIDNTPWRFLKEGDHASYWDVLCRYVPALTDLFGVLRPPQTEEYDSFEAFQAGVEEFGQFWDANSRRMLSIDDKNTIGLNNPDLSWEERQMLEALLHGRYYDKNIRKFVDLKDLSKGGLNQDFDFSKEGDWDKYCKFRKRYFDEEYDYNIRSFVPSNQVTESDLNDKDGDFDEFRYQLQQKHLDWDSNLNMVVGAGELTPGGLNSKDMDFSSLCAYKLALHGKMWINGEFVKVQEPNAVVLSPSSKFKEVHKAFGRLGFDMPNLVDSELVVYKGGYFQTSSGKYVITTNKESNDRIFKQILNKYSYISGKHRYKSGYVGGHKFWGKSSHPWIDYSKRAKKPYTKFKQFTRPQTSNLTFAGLRMAASGYKTYEDYYKFEYSYNYQYKNPRASLKKDYTNRDYRRR